MALETKEICCADKSMHTHTHAHTHTQNHTYKLTLHSLLDIAEKLIKLTLPLTRHSYKTSNTIKREHYIDTI